MNKALGIIVLLVLITPNLVLAAWWNPFSWWSSEEKIEDQIEFDENIKSDIDEGGVLETEQIDFNEINNQINEPQIEYITDPSLQSIIDQLNKRISVLSTENQELRLEIKKLREENISLSIDSQNISKEDEWCSEAKTDYYNVQKDIENVEEEKLVTYSGFARCGTLCNSTIAPYDLEIELLENKKDDIKEDVDNYCK